MLTGLNAMISLCRVAHEAGYIEFIL
jgi:hypothetical protein